MLLSGRATLLVLRFYHISAFPGYETVDELTGNEGTEIRDLMLTINCNQRLKPGKASRPLNQQEAL